MQAGLRAVHKRPGYIERLRDRARDNHHGRLSGADGFVVFDDDSGFTGRDAGGGHVFSVSDTGGFQPALLEAIEAQPSAKRATPAVAGLRAAESTADDTAITLECFFEALGAFVLRKQVRDRYILIVGESTSLYVFGNLFGLPAESFVAQAAWGSLGHETASARWWWRATAAS